MEFKKRPYDRQLIPRVRGIQSLGRKCLCPLRAQTGVNDLDESSSESSNSQRHFGDRGNRNPKSVLLALDDVYDCLMFFQYDVYAFNVEKHVKGL